MTNKAKIKRFKEIIINLNELLYNKKYVLTLNFPYKSKLKLNYIISSEQKDLSLFVKDAKEKKINIKKDNIFGFFNDKSEEKNKNIFGEMDSEEGEEEDESVKSNESESENIDEEDNYFFLKYRQPPKMKRSKSFHHKKTF